MRKLTRASFDPYFLGAIAIALLAAAVQLYRVGAPLSGYHGYNEGFYFTFALKDLGRGFLAPVLAPQDVNNPFLLPLVLVTVLRVFGPSVAAARAISIAASFTTVLLTFWVARQLYDRRVALFASAALAVAPGLLLTGRNIQLDPLMLMLEVAAAGAYLRALSEENPRWAIASGLLFGLGMLTKLPILLAVLALAVWRTWATGSWRWIRLRSSWMTALTSAVVALPWYAYNAARTAGFSQAQGALLERTGGWHSIADLLTRVLGEQFWMLSPVMAVLAVAGLVVMGTKRTESDKLVLVLAGLHLLVFAFNNKHSYYFLPLLPWASVAAARAVTSLRWGRRIRAAVVVGLAVLLILPFSVTALAAKKWSMLRIDRVPRVLSDAGYRGASTQVLGDEAITSSIGPALDYYLQQAGYSAPVPATAQRTGGGRSVLLSGDGIPQRGASDIGAVPLEIVSPVVFGVAIREFPGAVSYYTPTWPQLERVGPWWRFGVSAKVLPERIAVLWALPPQ